MVRLYRRQYQKQMFCLLPPLQVVANNFGYHLCCEPPRTCRGDNVFFPPIFLLKST